jgi:hypothetical protein
MCPLVRHGLNLTHVCVGRPSAPCAGTNSLYHRPGCSCLLLNTASQLVAVAAGRRRAELDNTARAPCAPVSVSRVLESRVAVPVPQTCDLSQPVPPDLRRVAATRPSWSSAPIARSRAIRLVRYKGLTTQETAFMHHGSWRYERQHSTRDTRRRASQKPSEHTTTVAAASMVAERLLMC